MATSPSQCPLRAICRHRRRWLALDVLHSWRRIAAVPDVARHSPGFGRSSFVNRNVLAGVTHGRGPFCRAQADRIAAALEGPITGNTHFIDGESELHAELAEHRVRPRSDHRLAYI